MGIISIVATLPILGAVSVPGILTVDKDNTNTKIEFVIEDNIQLNNGFIESKNNIPYNSENYEPVESGEETKREEKQTRLKNYFPQEKFIGNFSAYTAAADECGKSDGITASGIKVHEGTLACPPQYSFGTRVKVDGYGTFVCEDRGGAIKGNHFDIYMETKKEAFTFGRKNLLAEVVD